MDAQVEVTGQIAEVSGWDTRENFFVERALLRPHAKGNTADLKAKLRVGSLVFVRILDGKSMDRAMPVTYQVSSINNGTRDADASKDAREVEMVRLRPREKARKAFEQFTFRETSLN